MQMSDIIEILPVQQPLAPADQDDLRRAVDCLERVSLAARLTNLLGRQVDLATTYLPQAVRGAVGRATTAALRAALRVALRSLDVRQRPASRRFHKVLATASGAAGGAFGLAALPVELPASTILIMRSIADIARGEGEDLHDPEVLLACLEVFALGGRAAADDRMESGYFAARALFAKSITDAARFLTQRGVADEAAPALVRLIAQLAARYGMVVSQKVAAQALPFLGAMGGAAVNFAFADHFQAIAHGHFTVRRLERLYGKARVRSEYERLRDSAHARAT
jgi:hypothetical protein